MYQYRKKPIVIEAFQMTLARRYDNSEWPTWLSIAWNMASNEPNSLYTLANDSLRINTLEGVFDVEWGDYIIKGIKGELYPCKPDIFLATYEPIS